MVDQGQTSTAGQAPWLGQFGEVELIGGWAEVLLDDELARRIERPGYLVFVTSYDPVQVFVHHRTERSFEIHALPGKDARAQRSTRCGYWVVGREVAALSNNKPNRSIP